LVDAVDEIPVVECSETQNLSFDWKQREADDRISLTGLSPMDVRERVEDVSRDASMLLTQRTINICTTLLTHLSGLLVSEP